MKRRKFLFSLSFKAMSWCQKVKEIVSFLKSLWTKYIVHIQSNRKKGIDLSIHNSFLLAAVTSSNVEHFSLQLLNVQCAMVLLHTHTVNTTTMLLSGINYCHWLRKPTENQHCEYIFQRGKILYQCENCIERRSFNALNNRIICGSDDITRKYNNRK